MNNISRMQILQTLAYSIYKWLNLWHSEIQPGSNEIINWAIRTYLQVYIYILVILKIVIKPYDIFMT